jgi:alpha-L-fucosidase
LPAQCSSQGARGVRFVPYTPQDIRFTTKGDSLYAYAFAIPDAGRVVIKSLATNSPFYPGEIGKVELLGASGKVDFTRNADGLTVNFTGRGTVSPSVAFKITAKT